METINNPVVATLTTKILVLFKIRIEITILQTKMWLKIKFLPILPLLIIIWGQVIWDKLNSSQKKI